MNFRKLVAYLSLTTVALFVITGYGMTQYRTVEKITFGLLTKSLSFRIHSGLIIPLIVFLLIHVFYDFNFFRKIREWVKKY